MLGNPEMFENTSNGHLCFEKSNTTFVCMHSVFCFSRHKEQQLVGVLQHTKMTYLSFLTE